MAKVHAILLLQAACDDVKSTRKFFVNNTEWTKSSAESCNSSEAFSSSLSTADQIDFTTFYKAMFSRTSKKKAGLHEQKSISVTDLPVTINLTNDAEYPEEILFESCTEPENKPEKAVTSRDNIYEEKMNEMKKGRIPKRKTGGLLNLFDFHQSE